jgi:hypothetical protein
MNYMLIYKRIKWQGEKYGGGGNFFIASGLKSLDTGISGNIMKRNFDPPHKEEDLS